MQRQLLVALTLLLGCGESSADPNDPPRLVGQYVANSVKVGTFDSHTELINHDGMMTMQVIDDSSFSIAVSLPAPYAPFFDDPGGYEAELTGTLSLGDTLPNLHLVAGDGTPSWVTTSLSFMPDTIRGRFITDPPHDVEIAFVLVRMDN
jgi:hypothetical protein